MIHWTKQPLYNALRWSERYTKTDMVYFIASNIWINMGRVVAIVVGLGLTVVFANLLDPELFGVYKYVLAAAGLIGAFTLNNMSGSLMRAVAQGKQHVVPALVKSIMFWSVPASVVSCAIGGYYFLHDNQTLGYGFLFIALFNILSNGFGLGKSILIAKGDFKNSFFINIPRTAFPVAVVITALFLTQNVVWILAAYFFSNALASFVQYRWCVWYFNIKGSQQDVEEAIRFGKHLSALGFFVLASKYIDQLLLFQFTGGTELAIYALALAPVLETRNILDNILSILFPKLAAKDKEEALRSISLRLKQMTVVALVLTVAYITLVPFLFTFLFPKYLPAILVSQVLALCILFQSRGVIDAYIIAHGEIKKRYIAVLSSQAVGLILFFTLIPVFGLWGAVWATVLSEAVAALSLYVIYKTL